MYTLPYMQEVPRYSNFQQKKPDDKFWKDTLIGAGIGTAAGAGYGGMRAKSKAERTRLSDFKDELKSSQKKHDYAKHNKVLKSKLPDVIKGKGATAEATAAMGRYDDEVKALKKAFRDNKSKILDKILSKKSLTSKYGVPAAIGASVAALAAGLYSKNKD